MSVAGKVEFEMASHQHGRVFLTVAQTVSIKQGGDLVRLTFDEAAELQRDLMHGLAELRLANPAQFDARGNRRA